MLATVIIVLRETLEVCLLVGMVSAALNNLASKRKLIFAGVMVGAVFSGILALSLYKITNLFNGNGQEILNIIILAISIICIAWTLLWINKQGKELYNKVNHVSEKLLSNQISVWPMILIISLSMSREGAELILFLHGVSAAGTLASDLLYGIVIGAMIGAALGSLLSLGLLKVSPKYFFKLINIMLVLLAAGMAAQLANYLVAADIISVLSATLWDSSWLIDERGGVGKILHGLIGYSSRPTQLQFVFYSLTIMIMFRLLAHKKKLTLS